MASRHHRRRSLGTTTVVLGLITLSALISCSRSGPGEDPDPSGPVTHPRCAASNGRKATGAPIKVGAIATMTGGIDFSSSPYSARAYFDCVNANGGIKGRPVQYEIGDDGLDPQKASALAAKFAGDPDVVAMAGGASFVACAGNQPIYEKAGLLDVLGVGVPRACFYSRNMSAMNAGPRLSLISAVQMQARDFRVRSFAAGGYPVPGLGDWVKDGAERYAERAGLTLTSFDQVPPPIKDATGLVTSLASRHPDVMVLGYAASDNATYLKAAEQQGLADKVHFSSLTPSYDTTFPQQIGPYWNDRFYSNSEFALVDSIGPDNVNWRVVLKAFGTSDQPRDSFGQGGYLAARVLVDTLLTMDPTAITRQTVGAALRQVKGFRSDMLCRPWYFAGPNGHNNANHQLRNVRLDAKGSYVSAAECFETADPALADVLAAEAADPALVGAAPVSTAPVGTAPVSTAPVGTDRG